MSAPHVRVPGRGPDRRIRFLARAAGADVEVRTYCGAPPTARDLALRDVKAKAFGKSRWPVYRDCLEAIGSRGGAA